MNGKLNDYPDMLTVPHLCEILHVGKKTVFSLMNSGNLRYVKVGKRYISSKRWLRDYLEKCVNEN